jgi:hypothetical protein
MIRQLAPEPTHADDFMQHPLVHDKPRIKCSLLSVRFSPVSPSLAYQIQFLHLLHLHLPPISSILSRPFEYLFTFPYPSETRLPVALLYFPHFYNPE